LIRLGRDDRLDHEDGCFSFPDGDRCSRILRKTAIDRRRLDQGTVLSYTYYTMNAVFTARLPVATLKRLRERARQIGTTPSGLVRSLLDRELGPTDADAAALDRTRRWVGAVRSTRVTPGRDARAALAVWNPDRRG
jgi:hypothetical protein